MLCLHFRNWNILSTDTQTITYPDTEYETPFTNYSIDGIRQCRRCKKIQIAERYEQVWGGLDLEPHSQLAYRWYNPPVALAKFLRKSLLSVSDKQSEGET
jgi:hypothetical protein